MTEAKKKNKGSTCLAVTGTEGDVKKVKKGKYTATTTGDADYGNLVFAVPAGTTFSDIVSMQSQFAFDPAGHCGVGSPRFTVFLKNGKCPYAQFPPDQCSTPGASGSTGDVIRNQTPYVWNDDLCGGDAGNTTYAKVLTAYAADEVDEIELITDSSSGEATVTLKPCITLA